MNPLLPSPTYSSHPPSGFPVPRSHSSLFPFSFQNYQMATLSSFNRLSINSSVLRSTANLVSLPANSVSFSFAKPSENSKLSSGTVLKVRPTSFRVAAVPSEDEWGSETGELSAVAVEEPPKEPSEIALLKKQLVDAFYGTDRGLKATSETRAEVVELITQLEAKNPTPAPTDALTLLNGKWILAYTSFSGLFPLLSRSLPLVKVEEISQTIDSISFTVQNSVLFAGPLATTAISTNAKFEVRSPLRVQIKFEEGVIGTPQLTDSIEIPENVEIFGQKIDLTPFKGIITSVQDTASTVAKTISSQPPLKFSITSSKAESWLLTTYLDEELRISRGDGGSVFVLIKDGSSLLNF